MNDFALTIEQKEFISRYKDDRNFKLMINNPNIDLTPTIKELVFFEAESKSLINENEIKLPDSKLNAVMSEKFRQINIENKDINIQADKITSKSATIANNAAQIKKYTQADIRIKLIELQKDSHYKEIVPEITKLIPDD